MTASNGKALIPAPTTETLDAYAQSETPFYGDLLKFSGKDGCWIYGLQGLTLDRGTFLVAVVPEMFVGFFKWGANGLIDKRLVPLGAGFDAKAFRATLDERDRDLWEKDEDTGRLKDPWAEGFWLPLINSKTKAKYTYSSSSYGGRSCIKNLVGAYSEQVKAAQNAKRPPDLPVVEIGGDKHPARVKAHGMIHVPLLDVIGWMSPAEAFGAQEPELPLDGLEPDVPPHDAIPPEPEQDIEEPEVPALAAATQAKARKRANI